MTQSGHYLVLGLLAFDLTFSRIRLPLGHQALCLSDLVRGDVRL
jgi:hypothetical protein